MSGNLTPWRPGQSGNPKGYSRRRRIADKLVELLDAQPETANLLAKIALQMAMGQEDKLLEKGIKPNLAWFRVLQELADGGPVEVDHDHSGEVKVVVEYAELPFDGQYDDDDQDYASDPASGPAAGLESDEAV